MDIEVESTGNDYSSYYYSLEILKIFKHLKGQKLLSYVVKDTGSGLDASSYLNIFQCEDCSLYVWRRRSGAIFESCWQRVYFSAPKMDWAFLERVAEFMGRFGDEAEYSYDINKVVDDIILEIGIREVEGKLEEKVINVILKFSDNYLAPYLHAYELPFGCMPSKKDDKIYYYHCPKVGSDNLCTIYENRPSICKDFPHNPLKLLHSECSYNEWKNEVSHQAMLLKAKVDLIKFYKEKLG